jgi:LCP family protein required for cell wall assembly
MTRLGGVLPYACAVLLVAAGVFFGSVAMRMQTQHESFSIAVVNQVVHVPPPQEVFGKDRIYALVLGIDYDYDDKDQPYSSHARSDTIMVAGVDMTAKAMHVVSVLRDTDAIVAGRETKINAAYSEGGVPLADAVIGDFLGMPADAKGRHFDRYVVVRVNALKDLVDAIGGIDVPVTETMNYDDSWGHLHIHFKPGLTHMDGEQAQGYVRYRHDACSDPCRIKRQQQTIRIILEKLKRDRFNDLAHVAQLIRVFRRDVDTNLTTAELTSLAWSFKDADVANLTHADTIGYVDTKETVDGQTVVADETQRTRLVAALLGSYRPAASGAPARAVTAVLPASVHVVVQNGSGQAGAAGTLARALRARGYVVDAIGDADSFGYDTTQVQGDTDSPAAARVRADLGIADATIVPAPPGAQRGVVRVIVGKDAVAAMPLPAAAK